MEQVQFCFRGGSHLFVSGVTGPLSDHPKTHLFKKDTGRPGVTTDVIVTDDRDVVRGLCEPFAHDFELREDVVPDSVVGDVVTQRLGNPTEAFAANGNDLFLDVLFTLFRSRLDVVTDKTDRTLRLNGDPFVKGEQLVDLSKGFYQFLISTEDDVFLLEVGREVHCYKSVNTGSTDVIVPAAGAAVLSAADRSVADVDHIFDRSPYNPTATGVGTTPLAHDTGNGFLVGSNTPTGFGVFLTGKADPQVFFPVFSCFFGVLFQYLFDRFILDRFKTFRSHNSLLLVKSGGESHRQIRRL